MQHEVETLLLVDDDVSFRTRLQQSLAAQGFAVTVAGSLLEAKKCAESDTPEFAVVDLKLDDDSGLDVVKALHALDATTRIVVLTGYGSIATALESIRLGAVHYLTKPATAAQIVEALRKGLEAKPGPEPDAPSLAEVEWEHIQRVLLDCGGNISHAAVRLGLHRRSLQRKLLTRPA